MFRVPRFTSLVLVTVGLLVAGAFGASRPALAPARLPLKLEKGKVFNFQVERQRQSERPREGPEKASGKEPGQDTVKEGSQATLEYQITVDSVAASGEATLLASIKKAVIDSSGERSLHFDSSAAAAADEGETLKKLRAALGKSLSIKIGAEGRLAAIEGLNGFQPARPEGGDRAAWRMTMVVGENLAPAQIQGDLERMIGSGLHNLELEAGKTYELSGLTGGRIRAGGEPGRPGAAPGGRPRPRASEKPENQEKGEKKPEKKESAGAAGSPSFQSHPEGLSTSAIAGDQDDKKDEGGKKEGEKGANPRPRLRPGTGSQPPDRPLNIRDRIQGSGNIGLRFEGEAKEGEVELVKFAVVSQEAPARGRGESQAAKAPEVGPLGEATYRKSDGLLEKFSLKRESSSPASAARRFSSQSLVAIQRLK